MKKADSAKLVQHIEDAENWLKKAKEEYCNANPVRGELILNLAQAEVKYAWELSHHQYVSDVKKTTDKRRIKFLIPVAASIIMIIALTQFGRTPLPSQSSNQPPKQALAVNESLVHESFALHQTGVNQEITKQVARTEPMLSPDIRESKGRMDIPENQIVQNEPENSPNSISKVNETETSGPKLADLLGETDERGTAQNRSNLQPVSQLSIGEEPLTKENSHSLRDGK